ncbi:MAG: ATP-binding protein [Clostridia bacterium]|nr:ATP-binding protein [Clostridia bacterium]
MAFNKENTVKIREKYNTKHLVAENAADMRRSELWIRIPELREIDRRLSATGPRLMAISLRKSNETVAEVRADVEELSRRRAELLEAHGYPADYTDPHYECAKCQDSGYVDGKMCECMRRELILAGYESSGITRLMGTQRFDNFDLDFYRDTPATYNNMSYAFETMRSYAQDFDPAVSPNLILFGGTGLGKTHLSTAVAKTVIDRGYDVVYTGAIGMLADFERARFGNASGVESGNGTERYFDCDLLIIDDLGSEVSNQFTVSCIYNVINSRISLGRPTLISSNLNQKEIGERYWDRIASRLFGEYIPLVFSGKDVRKQKISKK